MVQKINGRRWRCRLFCGFDLAERSGRGDGGRRSMGRPPKAAAVRGVMSVVQKEVDEVGL